MAIINGRGKVGIRRPSAALSIVTDGLKLYLDAGQPTSYPGSGTVWTDISGNGNNGTLTNGPTYSSTNGGSIVFDGVNDFVDIPSNIVLNQPKTLSVWYYTTISSQVGHLLSRSVANYEMYQFSDGKIYTYWGSTYQSSIVATITLNQWNNFTYVLSGNTEFVYKNGILLGSSNLVGTPSYTNTGNLNVGRRNAGTQYINGRISNTLIYNRALSATEVLQNYNALKSRFGL